MVNLGFNIVAMIPTGGLVYIGFSRFCDTSNEYFLTITVIMITHCFKCLNCPVKSCGRSELVSYFKNLGR